MSDAASVSPDRTAQLGSLENAKLFLLATWLYCLYSNQVAGVTLYSFLRNQPTVFIFCQGRNSQFLVKGGFFQSYRCGNNGNDGEKHWQASQQLSPGLLCGEAKRDALRADCGTQSPSHNMDFRPIIDSQPQANICVRMLAASATVCCKKEKKA